MLKFKIFDGMRLMLPLMFAFVLAGCQSGSTVAQNTANSSGTSTTSKGTDGSGSQQSATAILAGGCFWCVEADFEKLPGVTDVVSGYSGGTSSNPTYENYGPSGHIEVVKVTYDPSQVTYAGLVEWLIKHMDPTDPDGSFHDRGKEYRPAVFYENAEEKAAAERVIAAIEKMSIYDKPLAVEVAERKKFWPAEDDHQDYHTKSLIKYDYYRLQSGRDAFIKKYWGDRASKLTLPGAVPEKRTANAEQQASDNKVAEGGKEPWEGFRKPPKEQLKKKLSGIEYEVTQEDGTETAFRNKYWDNKEEGLYVDIVSGEPLFSSKDKYKSGTGWPSFVKPVESKFIVLKADPGIFGTRTEVRSKRGDSHLGHVFDDGPPARGGKRYCMNSAALKFVPKEKMKAEGYEDYLPMVDGDEK